MQSKKSRELITSEIVCRANTTTAAYKAPDSAYLIEIQFYFAV